MKHTSCFNKKVFSSENYHNQKPIETIIDAPIHTVDRIHLSRTFFYLCRYSLLIHQDHEHKHEFIRYCSQETK